MYALVVTTWATAFIGAGLLASIPGAVLLLTQMGVILRVRELRAAETPPGPDPRRARPAQHAQHEGTARDPE
jgi:hypothetical protein